MMSYSTELQANNAELRECIEIADSLPDASDGNGSGNVLEEVLTITQACANAREVYDLFVSYLPDGVVSAMFEWIGNPDAAMNNQFMFGALLFTNGADTKETTRMLYMRYRSGSFGSVVNSGAGYDLVLSVGDKVRMIVAI